MSKHLMAKFRTAVGGDINIPPDEPHDDWRPIPGFSSSIEKWCPSTGETHAHYQVFIDRSSRTPSALWRSNHNGVYQGVRTVTPPGGQSTGYTGPMYSLTHRPDYLGHHETVEGAKAAAEEHFAETYAGPSSVGDYDLDSIMDEHGAPPAPRRGMGDDEDYGHIFGRRLARPGRGPSRGHQCDYCKGHARSAYEVNQVSIGDDYKGSFCDNCLQELLPSWYGGGDR